jgi:hypothetical protein
MLPGFRFLFAAIVLSMSVLVFGLGAAALLRAAHEEFANLPSQWAPPETVFAPQKEAAPPALAMLRVDAPVAEDKAADNVLPPAPPTEQPVSVSTPAEPETSAALQPEDSPALPETAKSEVPVAETSPQDEAPAQADTPDRADVPASADETKIAATEPAMPPADQPAPAVSEQASAPALQEAESAPTASAAEIATKIATLGGPPVVIETQPPARAAGDESAIKKRQQARRAARRRNIAARARLARQVAQQPPDPFAQPAIVVRNR